MFVLTHFSLPLAAEINSHHMPAVGLLPLNRHLVISGGLSVQPSVVSGMVGSG